MGIFGPQHEFQAEKMRMELFLFPDMNTLQVHDTQN